MRQSKIFFRTKTWLAVAYTSIHLISLPALAQTTENKINSTESLDTMETLIVEDKEANSENFLKAIAESPQLNKLLKQVASEEKAKSMQSKLSEQMDRFRIQLSIGLRGDDVTIGNDALNAEAFYQAIVEPSANGEQVRRHVYVFNVGTDYHHLRGKVQTKIIFSRYFKGPNARMLAIKDQSFEMAKGLDYTQNPSLRNDRFPVLAFWKKIPNHADDFKTTLADNETVRVEFSILGGLGWGRENIKNKMKFYSDASITKEALFSYDAQRIYDPNLRDIKARLRFFGMNNGVVAKAEVGVKSLWSRIPGFVGKIFSVGASLRFQGTVENPVLNFLAKVFGAEAEIYKNEALMVDYIFNIDERRLNITDSDSPEYAIDEIFSNIRKFGFMGLLDPRVPSEDLGKKLLSQAETAGRLAKRDFINRVPNPSVSLLFKGHLTSTTRSTDLEGNVSKILEGKQQAGSMNSYVRSQNELDETEYYLLDNSFRRGLEQRWAGHYEVDHTSDLDILMKSDKDQTVGPLIDVVSRFELKDKNLEADELAIIRQSLYKSLPDADDRTFDYLNFFPTENQHNAFFSSEFAFGAEALLMVGQLYDEDTLRAALYDFLLKHADRKSMRMPYDRREGNRNNTSYHEIIDPLAKTIFLAVAPSTTNEERRAIVNRLKEEPVFQRWLIAEFFPSLVPKDSTKNAMKLALTLSSKETQDRKPVVFGLHKTSKVYASVAFVRSVINNRTYDLRLDMLKTEDGRNMYLVKPQGQSLY